MPAIKCIRYFSIFGNSKTAYAGDFLKLPSERPSGAGYFLRRLLVGLKIVVSEVGPGRCQSAQKNRVCPSTFRGRRVGRHDLPTPTTSDGSSSGSAWIKRRPGGGGRRWRAAAVYGGRRCRWRAAVTDGGRRGGRRRRGRRGRQPAGAARRGGLRSSVFQSHALAVFVKRCPSRERPPRPLFAAAVPPAPRGPRRAGRPPTAAPR